MRLRSTRLGRGLLLWLIGIPLPIILLICADHTSDLVVWRAARLILGVERIGMSDTEERESAERVASAQAYTEKDALRLEDEKRAALVKNLYRLRALRLSRGRANTLVRDA